MARLSAVESVLAVSNQRVVVSCFHHRAVVAGNYGRLSMPSFNAAVCPERFPARALVAGLIRSRTILLRRSLIRIMLAPTSLCSFLRQSFAHMGIGCDAASDSENGEPGDTRTRTPAKTSGNARQPGRSSNRRDRPPADAMGSQIVNNARELPARRDGMNCAAFESGSYGTKRHVGGRGA